MSNYREKYLKYKSKYLQLKGGFYCPQVAQEGYNHNANEEEEMEKCPICIDQNVNRKFACCHCVCDTCYNRMQHIQQMQCPICKRDIDVNRVWELRDKKWIRREARRERQNMQLPFRFLYGLVPRRSEDIVPLRRGQHYRLPPIWARLNPNEPQQWEAHLPFYIENAEHIEWDGRPPQVWIDAVRASELNQRYEIQPDPDLYF